MSIYGRVLLATLILGNTAPVFAIAAGDGGERAPNRARRRLRGRVNAAYRLISWEAIPVGATVGGACAPVAVLPADTR